MSRNRKYIEQFDRNAGKPSDFDSLFDFEKDKLIAKRRIKVKSARRYIAAMCSAAAVIGIAAFAALSLINEKGIASDRIISKSEGMTPSAEFTEYLEEETALPLSSLTGHFDYNASGDISSTEWWSIPMEWENSDISPLAIRFNVISKSYIYPENEIRYQIKLLEYYADDSLSEYLSSLSDHIVTLSYPVCSDVTELQTGGEYIMPVGNTAGGLSVMQGESGEYTINSAVTDNFARRTDKGWLIYRYNKASSPLFEALSADTEQVFDDIDGTDRYCLEPSDERMAEKLKRYFESIDDTVYHSVVDDSDGVSRDGYYNLSSILSRAQFEKVSYGIDSEGRTDMTLLVLDNEKYFSLMPYLSGVIMFAGENEKGELCVAQEIKYDSEPDTRSYAKTVLFSGFESLNVSTGETLDEEAVIGECSEKPIYMQFIDNNGVPMEIELNKNLYETSVYPFLEE